MEAALLTPVFEDVRETSSDFIFFWEIRIGVALVDRTESSFSSCCWLSLFSRSVILSFICLNSDVISSLKGRRSPSRTEVISLSETCRSMILTCKTTNHALWHALHAIFYLAKAI